MKTKKCLTMPNNYCDGKHIPSMEIIGKNKDGRLIVSDKDLSKTKDKEPCKYFVNKKCTKI